MSAGDAYLAVLLGIVAGPAALIVIVGICVFAKNCWVWLAERGIVAVCRCGAEFGCRPYQTFKYSVDSVPVYKEHKGSLDRITFIKAAWHRKFTCEGEASE